MIHEATKTTLQKPPAGCEGVLLVEDDLDLRETLRMILEMEGIPVKVSTHGQEALEILSNPPYPCVIVLDLMMPVMNGWDFLAQRRKRREIHEIPVVLSTAFTTELPNDVDTVLKKPVELDRFLRIVQRYFVKAA